MPDEPFLCRLLLDNSASSPPYPLAALREAVATVSPDLPSGRGDGLADARPRWQQGLAGAAEGERNVTAASLVGRVLRSLPEELWETAGWGGLKEWNGRNPTLLPERELRAVYESIARRERTHRRDRPEPLPVPSARRE